MNLKIRIGRRIGVFGYLLAAAIFCWSCAVKPPIKEEPTPSPAPRVEEVALKEAPPAPPEPPPLSKKESVPAPGVMHAPARQETPPSAPAPKETKPQEVFFMHTVKWSGETLSIISLWYTGDPKNWKTIAQANPEINPSRIFGGLEILIPEKLMKKHDPLPKAFVDRFNSRPVKEKPKTQEEEPKLFGPRSSSK